MVFVYRIFNCIVSPTLRTLVFAYLFCVVGIKGHVFVYRVFNSIISPKLRTFNVCISFLRCWNQGPMVFVYRIFNSYHLSYVLWLFAYVFCVVGIKGRY